MGLLTSKLGINALSMEDPAQPLMPYSALFESMGLGRSDAGIMVNEKQAMRLSTCFACITVISFDLSRIPLIVYQRMPDNSIREATEHRLYNVLRNTPNSMMTSAVFRSALIASVLGWGNSYAYIKRDRAARVVSLHPLASDKTTPVVTDDRLVVVTTQTPTGQQEFIDGANVLKFTGLTTDGIVGMSPIQTCKNAFGLSLAAEKFGAQFFGNGAKATGVLSHPSTLEPEAYENLKKSVREWATGDNALRPIILEEGMKWDQITIAPNDAQFILTRRFQRQEIAGMYRVPLHMIQDLERATNNNIEHQSLDYVRYCLTPWAVRIEQEINTKLLGGSYFVEHDLNDIMRGDFASQTSGFQALRNIGVLSTNDILRSMRRNPIPASEGGDVRTVQGAMIPLEALTAAGYNAADPEESADATRGALPAGDEGDGGQQNRHPGLIFAYRRLYRDAIGRITNRANPDDQFAYRALYPATASLAECLRAAADGNTTLNDTDEQRIASLTRELCSLRGGWTAQNISAKATEVTVLAYKELSGEDPDLSPEPERPVAARSVPSRNTSDGEAYQELRNEIAGLRSEITKHPDINITNQPANPTPPVHMEQGAVSFSAPPITVNLTLPTGKRIQTVQRDANGRISTIETSEEAEGTV